MLARLPARYRSVIWVLGLLASTVVSVWLAVLIRGPLLTATDVVLSLGGGLVGGVLGVHAFLALLFSEPAAAGPAASSSAG